MSTEPPSRPDREGAPAEPFTRGRIEWSRPPRPVFRVGPLPRPEVAPGAAPPPRKPGAGILTGSMIPPRRVAPDIPEPAAVSPSEAEAAPEAPEPAPPPPPPPLERIVEIEPAEMTETVAPLSGNPEPAVAPRSLPSVVVTPTLYATVGAAIQTVKKNDRWIVVAAVAAVVITAGFVWLATLPAGDAPPLDMDSPPPPAVSSPAVEGP